MTAAPPGTGGLRVIDGIAERIFQPLSRRGISNIHLEHGRQPGEDDSAKLRVTSQIPADQLRDFTAPGELGQHASLREDLPHLQGSVHRCDGWAVTHEMRIAMRENDDVARRQRHGTVFLLQADIPPSFEQ
jgi:hypothetical protein